MDAQEQLFGLIAAAKEQQKAVQTALDGLTQERKALVDAVNAAKDATPALTKALEDAASTAVGVSLDKAPKAAMAAFKAAREALDDATTDVTKAGAWLGVKFIFAFAFSCLVLLAALIGLGRWMVPSADEIAELRAEKVVLENGIAALAKKGGRIKLRDCGGRLCIEASSNQGKGFEKWESPSWNDQKTGASLVILRGY